MGMNLLWSHCSTYDNLYRIYVSCLFSAITLLGLTRVILRAVLLPSLAFSLVALLPPPLQKRASFLMVTIWHSITCVDLKLEQVCFCDIYKEVSTSGFFHLKAGQVHQKFQARLSSILPCLHPSPTCLTSAILETSSSLLLW